MIEQTWSNTPWIRIYLTNGRAILLGSILLMWMGFFSFVSYVFGKQHGKR